MRAFAQALIVTPHTSVSLGTLHPHHEMVSRDTYLWTLEVYYRYMSKLMHPIASRCDSYDGSTPKGETTTATKGFARQSLAR